VGACLCVSSACSGPESNDQGVGETGEGQGPDKLDDKPIQNGEDRDKRDEISRWKARHWPQRLARLVSTLSAEAACLPGPSEFVCLWNAGESGEQREHWPPRSDLSRHVQTTFGSEEISHDFRTCIHAPLSRWTRSPVTHERDRPGATARGLERGMGTCMILLIHAWPLSVAWKGLMSHDVTCHPLLQDSANRERQRFIATICVLKKTLRGRTAAQGTVRRARRPVIS
jgi:hypothetical protein